MDKHKTHLEIWQLIEDHKDKFITPNYTIRYSNRMSRALASCRHFTSLGRVYKIEFVFNNKYINANLDNWERIKTTVLHEIAHAIVGHAHGHDRVWVNCCKSIGGDGERLAKKGTFNDWV